jgi:hypothetical protein
VFGVGAKLTLTIFAEMVLFAMTGMLRQAYGEQLLGSPAHTYYDHFQRLFCEAIAEHYLIVPD